MTQKSTAKKLLSVFLSLIMAFSAFGMLTFEVSAAGAGSVTNVMWNDLANALRSDNVKNANFSGTSTVTVNDPSGDVYTAAKAYFAVLNAYIFKATGSSGSESESGYNYRTSSQVRDLVKTKMSELMGADYDTYSAGNAIQYLGGNVTVSGNTNTTQNSVPTTTVKVTVVRLQTLTSYATFAELAEAHSATTYTYTINHTNTRNYTPSGCGAKKTYYCTCSSASSSESGSANVDISALTAYNNVLTNETNATILGSTQASQIAQGYETLTNVYSSVSTAKENAVNAFTSYVVGHFFGSFDPAIEQLKSSKTIAEFAPIVERINGYVATDISGYNLSALTDIYEDLRADYESYKAIGIPTVYAYFETDNNILDRAVVEAKYAEIEDAYQLAYLREVVKPPIVEAVREYLDYNDDWVLENATAEADINAAKNAVNGYIETLGTYNPDNVDTVFGAGYTANVLYPLINEFDRLLEVDDYKVLFESYKSVYTTAFEPVDPSYSTEQLYSVLSVRDGWYTNLQSYAAELREYNP
ncbi:MAG: hypothetical protein IJS90_03495, partial [Clostridia bacterium]|nr:hypothetical protein [Clostridia bacterium]